MKFVIVINGILNSRLVERDAHQLYQRLESLGREYIMEIKVNLLQIIVSPDKVSGLNNCEKEEDDVTNGNGNNHSISIEQAKLFLKSTLDYFSRYQETVRNMYSFMRELVRIWNILMNVYIFAGCCTFGKVWHYLESDQSSSIRSSRLSGRSYCGIFASNCKSSWVCIMQIYGWEW